jgi:hydroxymethylbilane synthase
MTTLRLGTRGSLLARTQSQQVADSITAATGVAVELVIIKTTGDRVQDRPLQEVGGKGLFTKEIEDALIDGRVDFAVHSMKDMPTENPPELEIASVPKRVDPRDVLIGAKLADLPRGAVVGTGSVRRQLQLRALRPDLVLKGIRGNVDTRIAKQQAGDYDAIVLAAAGITRLGKQDEITDALSVEAMIPAVGQGALALQCRRDDAATKAILDKIHHEPSAICVAAERAFLEAVSGGCSAPAACHAVWDGDEIVATGVWAVDETSEPKRLTLRTDPLHAPAMGRDLARQLKG